jgi:hypothetical protein
LKVTLQFKNSKDLWEFKTTTGANCVQINTAECTLICDCSEADIELAIKEYNAVVRKEITGV